MNLQFQKSHRIFFGISSFQMLAMFRRGLFYTYLSIYLRYFLGLSVTGTTLFATLPMLMNIIFQTFVWGSFSDKYQLRRTLIICGEMLAGVGTILVWYGHTLTGNLYMAGYVIIFGLSIIEIFWSMSNVGWSALISDIYHREDRNAVQGRLESIGGIGRIAGVWIGGLLYDGMGLKYNGWGFYDGALFFVAAAAMFISVVPMLWVPEGGVRRETETLSVSENNVPVSAEKVFTIFIIGMVFINFGRNSIVVILPQYLVLASGFAVSSTVLSYIVNTQSIAIVLTGFIAGWIGRKIGDENALLFGAALAAGSLILLATAGNLTLIYVSNFLRGCSMVIVMASSYAFASVLIPPEKRAKLFSIFNATFFLSWGIAGTFIAGPITDMLMAYGKSKVFSYQMAFISSAVMTLIGFFIQGFLLLVYIPKNSN
ncbi:MAG: MFS transporter [Desulfobacterales bacterium]